MTKKTCIYIGFIIGLFIGMYAPQLWGSTTLTFTSIITSGIGAFVGIWGGYKVGTAYFG